MHKTARWQKIGEYVSIQNILINNKMKQYRKEPESNIWTRWNTNIYANILNTVIQFLFVSYQFSMHLWIQSLNKRKFKNVSRIVNKRIERYVMWCWSTKLLRSVSNVGNQKFNKCIQEIVFATSRHESCRFITIAIYNLEFRVQFLYGVYCGKIARKNSILLLIDHILPMPI